MTDLFKAILIGTALTAAIIALPVVIAVVVPVAIFSACVGLIWFLLQVIRHDDDETPEKPP